METGPDQVRRPSSSQALPDLIAEQWGASISHDPLPPIDSADATPTHWEMIHAAISRSPAVPVLLTHGTDTLSWTAAALAAAADRSHTVVVTGATVPLGEPGSDAPDNLAAALVAARELPVGIWVVFTSGPGTRASVFEGGFVRKVAPAGQSFVDTGGTPLGVVEHGRLRYLRPPRPALVLDKIPRHDEVALVHAWPGASWPDTAPAPLVVLGLYVCNTVPSTLITAVARWIAHGTTVIAAVDATSDRGTTSTAHYSSHAALREAGVLLYGGVSTEILTCAALRPPSNTMSPGPVYE